MKAINTSAQCVRKAGARSTKNWVTLGLLLLNSLGCFQVCAQYQGTPQRWSNASTWGGAVPGEYQDVTIPAGRTVVLDVPKLNVGKLWVYGDLILGDNDVDLNASEIIVHGGLLEIGTEARPYARRCVITLRRGAVSEMGEKCLGAMRGGRIEIHGSSRDKVSWTQLAASALPGQTHIDVIGPVNWVAGDKIVIATTSMNPEANDVVTVQSVTGKRITFSPALKFDHFGRVLRYGGKDVDMRAEVGLLNRNILIQGDTLSESDKIGGHLMVMHETIARPGENRTQLNLPAPGAKRSSLRIEGAELFRMGQKTRPGRYAMHWHLMGDASGNYARNNSIHHSYQRAINIHGTSHVNVNHNVCFDIQSHGIVPSEEGDEFFNVFKTNLVVQVYAIPTAEHSFPEDRDAGLGGGTQGEKRAGGFWMRSSLHTFHGNHVAGVMQGNGYFFELREWSDKQSRDRAGGGPMTDFVDNVAHSILQPIEVDDIYVARAAGFGLFTLGVRARNSGKLLLRKFTCYKAQAGGAWIEHNSLMQDSIIADCQMGIFGLQDPEVHDLVIVGQTENTRGDSGTIQAMGAFNLDRRTPVTLSFAHPQVHRGGIHRHPRQDNAISISLDSVKFINLPAAFLHEGGELTLKGSRLSYQNVLSRVVSTVQGEGLILLDGDGTLGSTFEGLSAKLRPVFDQDKPTKLEGLEWVASQTALSEGQGSGSSSGGSGTTAGSTGGGTSGGAFSLKVNFQDSASQGYDGYVADGGHVFGTRGGGHTFGWSVNNQANARNRNIHTDERLDTLNHLQKVSPLVWEAAVPNGRYSVRIVAGDPVYKDQVNHLDIEGTLVQDSDGPDLFDEYTVIVQVSDGRLTVKAAGSAKNAKVCTIEILSQ